jgi:hypothetical protein
MKKSIAVWVDHTLARVVEAKPQGPAVTTIESGIERPTTLHAHIRHKGEEHVGSAEEKRSLHRRQEETRAFLDRITGAVAGADRILILGHGPAKDELRIHLEADKRTAGRIAEVRAVDRMDEPQLLDAARAFFGAAR